MMKDSTADEYDEASAGGGIFNPSSPVFRVMILVGACLLTFGSYYCYDIVGALSDVVVTQYYGVSEFEYSLLYSVYSLPNTILPFVGGVLVDRILGVRFGGLLFSGLCFIGQLVWAVGGFFPDTFGYLMAVTGRFIFGLGGESLSVTQSAYIAKWFDNVKNPKMALAFGITLAFSRIGSAINFIITPLINTQIGFDAALWLGALTTFVSCFAALQLAFTDWRGAKIRKPAAKTDDNTIQFKDVLKFRYSLFILIAVCVLFYISIFIFLQYASGFFQWHYGMDDVIASEIVSIPYLVAAFAAPVFGFLVDQIGYILYWLVAACALNSICMAVMIMFTFIPPPVVLVFIGLAYSIVAASLWPCIPLIVKPHEHATAYGLFFAIQNAGLFAAPLILSSLIGALNQYVVAVGTFSWCALCACMLTSSLAVCDYLEPDEFKKINMSSANMNRIDRLKNGGTTGDVVIEAVDQPILRKTDSINDYGYDDNKYAYDETYDY